MDDLKFRIVEIKKKPDVTTITAECLKDGEAVKINIATILANDKGFIKAELTRNYLAQTTCELKEGETI